MISLSFILTGFLLGLASSLHCIGMCGPLALALPIQGFSQTKKVTAIGVYNFGRIISYISFGILTGILGRQFSLAGYQDLFSILIGALMLACLFISSRNRFFGNKSMLYRRVQTLIITHIQNPSLKNILITGIGNGLLPCGMVYIAAATASASGNIVTAGAFMLAFGVGTVPLMSMVSLIGLRISPAARNRLRKSSPYLTAILGALLILRGLNLGIPYISPILGVYGSNGIVSCH